MADIESFVNEHGNVLHTLTHFHMNHIISMKILPLSDRQSVEGKVILSGRCTPRLPINNVLIQTREIVCCHIIISVRLD